MKNDFIGKLTRAKKQTKKANENIYNHTHATHINICNARFKLKTWRLNEKDGGADEVGLGVIGPL